MRFAESFAHPKLTFLWRGGQNFFGPHQNGPKALEKMFLMTYKSFLGSVRLSELKIADFRPTKRYF